MDVKDIQNLMKFIAKLGVNEVSYKDKNFEIKVKKEAATKTSVVQPIMQQPVAQSVPIATQASQVEEVVRTPEQSAAAAEIDNANYITIKSPMIGTFYRKPSPDKDVFVNVGDTVSVNSVVCVIEAMKLFNEIESEVSGKIVKILVDDASPVEYDQPLFLVDPS